ASSNVLSHPLPYVQAIFATWPHLHPIKDTLSEGAPPITISVLASTQSHLDAIIALLESYKTSTSNFPQDGVKVLDAAGSLKNLVNVAIDTVGTAVRYELVGGANTRLRLAIGLNNPVAWQDAPETQPSAMSAGSRLVSMAKSTVERM